MEKQLLIATTNKGKREEIAELLKSVPLKLVTPDEIGLQLEVEENGSTYQENARLKALAYCRASKLPALADDSGLEVAALNGQPGLHSARFTGSHNATDKDRRDLLVARLADKPRPWTARFVCAFVLALPDGSLKFNQDICEGEIIPEERGSQGFGYDPIFFIPEMQKTMAELDMDVKNHISHRARAIMGMIPTLIDLYAKD